MYFRVVTNDPLPWDRYLGELVRYIHLNPVRAKMVRKAERYRWSSHRTYLRNGAWHAGRRRSCLRLFRARKKKARENFAGHVAAGARLGHNDEFYSTGEEGILGSEEFIDATIHRLGEKLTERSAGAPRRQVPEFNADVLVAIIERLLDIRRESFYGSGKSRHSTVAKELLILTGRQAGANVRTLSQLVGWTVDHERRLDTAIRRARE